MLTSENFKLYLQKKKELKQLYSTLVDDLRNKALEVLQWENENIGTNHELNPAAEEYQFDICKTGVNMTVTSPLQNKQMMLFLPYEKLLSDDWKEEALEIYRQSKEV